MVFCTSLRFCYRLSRGNGALDPVPRLSRKVRPDDGVRVGDGLLWRTADVLRHICQTIRALLSRFDSLSRLFRTHRPLPGVSPPRVLEGIGHRPHCAAICSSCTVGVLDTFLLDGSGAGLVLSKPPRISRSPCKAPSMRGSCWSAPNPRCPRSSNPRYVSTALRRREAPQSSIVRGENS